MPSVPVINTTGIHSTKDYVPLDDQVEAVVSPTSAVNGSVVYSKPLSSHGHHGSGSAGGSRWVEEEEGDIGAVRYKGKERAWDETSAAPSPSSTDFSHHYPPLSQAEEEEKRVQANLAKFTARETARRKAARASRVFPSATESNASSASSSTTSLPRSRLSSMQGGTAKRGSVFGNLLHKGKGSRSSSTSSSQSNDLSLPSASAANAQTAYPNPYDSPGESEPLRSPGSALTSPVDASFTPSMKKSSPFADPSIAPSQSSWDSPAQSPTSPQGNYGYQGQHWRGGAAVADAAITPPKKEKWWHALCAWGNDLDGGHGSRTGNQAGRTNPFE